MEKYSTDDDPLDFGSDSTPANDAEVPRYRRERRLRTRTLGWTAFVLACGAVGYVATGTDQFKEVASNVRAGIASMKTADYSGQFREKLDCAVRKNQHLSQTYARSFVSSKLGHGTEHHSKPIYAMNVSCQQPIDKQELQNGIHVAHLELISNHLFEGCVLLPADTASTDEATTQHAQAYCRLDLELA